MDWYGLFRADFFAAWAAAGLPPPDGYAEKYAAALKRIRFPRPKAVIPQQADPALDPALLDSVYGFGVYVGQMFGRLLNLPEQTVRERATWCGRFNLGISLFDYVCDERGRPNEIRALPAFHSFGFAGPETAPRRPADAAEELLNRLAASVLRQLEREDGHPASRAGGGLRGALKEMFRAELKVAASPVNAATDLTRMRRALRLKSVEPFRVMAEWMALGGVRRVGPARLTRAGALGRALGHCYWLMDDAKDVWADLDAGRWNLFLVWAASREPDLFARGRDAIIDVRLTRMWARGGVIKRTTRPAVRRVVEAVAGLGLAPPVMRDLLGLFAASLARW